MSKPGCTWTHQHGDSLRRCSSLACHDFPVCRSHLRVWANAKAAPASSRSVYQSAMTAAWSLLTMFTEVRA
jgi:hypothetical protein